MLENHESEVSDQIIRRCVVSKLFCKPKMNNMNNHSTRITSYPALHLILCPASRSRKIGLLTTPGSTTLPC